MAPWQDGSALYQECWSRETRAGSNGQAWKGANVEHSIPAPMSKLAVRGRKTMMDQRPKRWWGGAAGIEPVSPPV